MLENVYKWIEARLGRVIKLDAAVFAQKAKDGYLISEILENYGIINKDQLNMIERSDNIDACITNFNNHIRGWLKTINIELSDITLFEIVHSNTWETIHLLYQIYLQLNDQSELNFVSKQRENEKLRPPSDKFSVKEVTKKNASQFLPFANIHCAPLLGEHDVIHWHKDHMDMLLKQCKTSRENYESFVAERKRTTLEKSKIFSEIKPCTDLGWDLDNAFPEPLEKPYEELLKEGQITREAPIFQPNAKEAKRIVNVLKVKKRYNIERNVFKQELQKELIGDFWRLLKQSNDDTFTENISNKLLKQSTFEKQMINNMAEVKLQKQMMLESKKVLEDQLFKEKEQEFVQQLVLKDKGIQEEKFSYYMERERLLELHKRLYEQRKQLKAERHRKMCEDIMADMVNIALREAEYKQQYGEEPPRRVRDNWHALFEKGEPIFDLVEPVADIIKNQEDTDEATLELIEKEIERQEVLDEKDFDNYLQFNWPWDSITDHITTEILKEITCALNVMGFIAHKLLLTKYPLPPPPIVPSFPEVKIAACVNGLFDLSCIPNLQKLLNHKDVKVIQMEEVINYCVEAYKAEIKTEYDDGVLVDETTEALKKPKGKKPKTKKKDRKPEKKSKKSMKHSLPKLPEEPVVELPQLEDKPTQTPRLFPCEEVQLTEIGEFGEIAYESIALGVPVADFLLVRMFVEYLKSIPNLKGWVLINFPTNYTQAALLEEVLTGQSLPGVLESQRCSRSIYSYVEIEPRYEEKEPDKFVEFRKSTLLPNPVMPEEIPPVYETYLTAYIKIMPKPQVPEENTNEEQPALPPAFADLVDTDDPLEKYYSEMGCNYSLYYENFDFSSVKYLAKLIIGDFSLPIKTSLDLFGDTVRYIEAGDEDAPTDRPKSSKIGAKKEKQKGRFRIRKEKKPEGTVDDKKDKKSKGSAKDKKKKKKKKVKVFEDKGVQMPEIEEEEELPFEEEEPPPTPKAGEHGWDYVNLSLDNDFQVILATILENVEDIYVGDMKELFFLKRTILDAVIPYVQFVSEHIGQFLCRPDNKQSYLKEFQTNYNEINPDFRTDDEFKAELHCQIQELQETLEDISYQRMVLVEEERKGLIGENWVPKQICELANYCVTHLQLEIDRCVNSMQLISDYYASLVTKMPTDVIFDQILISKIESAVLKQPGVSEAINHTLEHVDAQKCNTIFHAKLEEKLKEGLDFVKNTNTAAVGISEKISSLFKPGAKKQKGASKKSDKKSGHSVSGDTTNLMKIFEPEEIVKQNYEKIMDEWNCAVKGETARANMRLKLIKFESIERIDEILNCCRQHFHGTFEDIRTRYENELSSIREVCRILARAVEEEVPIQQELILIGDKFLIHPSVLLFEDPLVTPDEEPLEFELDKDAFTVEQLDYIASVLLDLAPSGYLPERSFVYLLQDLILHDAEDGQVPMVPQIWSKLSVKDVQKIADELFDSIEYVQWKGFILLNLIREFPSENQLLTLRYVLRSYDPDTTELVTDYQFFQTKFWFETDNDVQNKLIKKLLFKLYKVKDDYLNYTAMLLDLCKDVNPLVGFAKALEVSLGKLICWDEVEGTNYVEGVFQKRLEDEIKEMNRVADKEECLEIVDSVIMEVIDSTVHRCDSVFIEDILSEVVNKVEEEVESKTEISDLVNGENVATENSIAEIVGCTEVGFESEEFPPMEHFLPFNVLSVIVVTTLPWNAKVQSIDERSLREHVEEIYDDCRNLEFNNSVLAHEFINNENFKELLQLTNYFTYKNLINIIKDIVNNKSE